MATVLQKKTKKILFLAPLVLLCLYAFIESLSYGLHDFLNSYFPALLALEGIPPESVIFDIHDFNQYAWDLGYDKALLDYYLNSPFTPTAFYLLAFFQDPFVAKVVFNIVSIFLFLAAVYRLGLYVLKDKMWVLIFLPILFYVPIRNQVLFGQSYFLIFALVVFGYLHIVKKKMIWGSSLLGIAVLLKFFPVFYGLPLLFAKRWRPIVLSILIAAVIVLFSVYLTGYSLWEYYFTEVLPNAIKNKTTIDFRSNYQSFDVFFKTLFVQDEYYNPKAWKHNESLYVIANWLIKSVVLGAAVFLSILKKKNLIQTLAIWVVALFLLQSRTATYAQILWIVPALVIYQSALAIKWKLLFFGMLVIACNFPYHTLINAPIGFRFLRLWLTIGMAVLFYKSQSKKWDVRFALGALILFLPLHLNAFKGNHQMESDYVIAEKKHFMICDFDVKDGVLIYEALGRSGLEEVSTTIPVHSFESQRCIIKDNQVFVDGKQITYTNSLKKRAVLINDCNLYFLTDHRSRHGAYTLKKMEICAHKPIEE